ncbi:MAG: ferredoxin [Verrucomicrobiae bacterium]|nr:ferredoxin [Verrucomicrobiae bacterium]
MSGDKDRRGFLKSLGRLAGLAAVAGLGAWARPKMSDFQSRWQLDPRKCVQCGRCATACVLKPSAVKCVHAHAICGYCDLCTGFFVSQPNSRNTGAENQQCPTGAIKRAFVEDPYFEYSVDPEKCIACARCVKGCTSFGNGSLFLQVMHDRCQNCNQCAIARVCPAQAFSRISSKNPYRLKGAA